MQCSCIPTPSLLARHPPTPLFSDKSLTPDSSIAGLEQIGFTQSSDKTESEQEFNNNAGTLQSNCLLFVSQFLSSMTEVMSSLSFLPAKPLHGPSNTLDLENCCVPSMAPPYRARSLLPRPFDNSHIVKPLHQLLVVLAMLLPYLTPLSLPLYFLPPIHLLLLLPSLIPLLPFFWQYS